MFLNYASYRLAISLLLICIFSGALICSFIWAVFLPGHACYIVRDGVSCIYQGGATQVGVLWYCMWGRGLRGNSATCLALGCLSVTSPTTHKQIGSFWCWFPGGWACVCSKTLWVSPMNSPVRLGVSPAPSNLSQRFSVRGFEALFPHTGTLDCAVCLAPQLFLPVYLQANVGSFALPAAASLAPVLHPPLCCKSSPLGCPSPPLLPVWIKASFLTPWLSDFHTVWFSDSSGNFCFKFVVVFLVVWGGKVYLPYASILAGSTIKYF